MQEAQLKQMTIEGSSTFRGELREKLGRDKDTLLKETGISVTNKRLHVCAFLQEQEAYYTKILRELDLPHKSRSDKYYVSLLLMVKQGDEDHQVPHKDSASKKIYWISIRVRVCLSPVCRLLVLAACLSPACACRLFVACLCLPPALPPPPACRLLAACLCLPPALQPPPACRLPAACLMMK